MRRLLCFSLLLTTYLMGCRADDAPAPTPAPQPIAVEVCTLIGCEDTLRVVVEGIPTEELISVTLIASQTVGAQADCAPADGTPPASTTFCEGTTAHFALYPGTLPDEVTVEVEWAGGMYSEQVRPKYEIEQPNGPKCDPTCRHATVTVRVPR